MKEDRKNTNSNNKDENKDVKAENADDIWFDDLEEDSYDDLEAEEPYDDFDGDDSDDDDPDDDFEEEEPQFMSLKIAMIFVGMLIVAGIICALLWMGTHRGKNTDDIPESSGEESFVEETLAKDPEDVQTGSESVEGMPEETMDNMETGADAQTSGEAVQPENQNGAASDDAQSGNGNDNETSGNQSPDNNNQSSDNNAQGAENGQTTDDNQPVQEPVSGTTSMTFTAVSDTVTAKDVTNLRSAPSTKDAENVIGQLKNGESLSRTGVNETTGWSKLEYNGQTVYAVTQYLTTDLTYKTPVKAGNPNRINTQDGRVIIFVDCDDNVTPKEYVNLRTEPSTSQGNATARCQISNGTSVHRTGYSPDSGWSRVEYNGEILYVVSSMVYTVQ